MSSRRSRSKSRKRSERGKDDDEDKRSRDRSRSRSKDRDRSKEKSKDRSRSGEKDDKPEGEGEGSFHEKEEEKELDPVQVEERKKRMKNAERFKKYLNKNGLPLAFQVVFAEILAKGIKEENVFSYTAMRLRQIGNDIIQITNWSDPKYHKNEKEMTTASNLLEKKGEKNLKTPSKKIKVQEDIGTTARKRRALDPDRKFKEDKVRSSQGNESVFTSNLKRRKRIVSFSKASGKNVQKKKMIKLKKRKKKFLKLRNSEGRKFTYEIFDDAVLNLPLKIQLKVIKAKNDDDFDTDEDQCQRSSYYCLKEVEEAQSHILRRKKLI